MLNSLSKAVCFSFVVGAAVLFAGCKGGDSDRLPEVPGLELSLTAGSPGDQNVAADANTFICHIHLEATTAENVSISSVTLSASGTGNDLVDIDLVEIFLDADDDDAYNPAVDVLIGSGAFDADDGRASITFGSPLIVSPGPGRNWLIRYQLSGMGPDGATYSFSIASASDVNVKFFSGVLTTADGLPLTSSVLTITSGGARLNLLPGPNPPPARSVLKGTANVPVLQFTLYNRDPDSITVTAIRVTPSGSGNDATGIAQAYLLVDSNGSGTSNTGDVTFGSFTYPGDNTAVDVTGSEVIAPGAMKRFLVVYDISGSAVVGSDFQAEIALTTHIQAEDSVPVSVVPVGTVPLQGAVVTIAEKGSLSAQAGANNPAGGSALAGSSNVAVLQVELQAGTLEDVLVDSFSVHATGSADDVGDFPQVKLYRDANGDGDVDGGDTELANSKYTADDGIIVFGSVGLTVPAGGSENLLVTYSIAATSQMGATFSAYVMSATEIAATGAVSALSITPTGSFPISGGTFQIRTPDTFMAAGSLNTRRFMHTQTTFTDPGDGKVKVLVCGGTDGTSVLDSAEVYDPVLDTWTLLAAPMSKTRMLHTATLLADGQRIVIAGGTNGVITHQDGEMFDPATYTFTPIADNMAARRQMHTGVLTDQGDVFYIGGQYLLGAPLFIDSTEYYNEPVNRFDMVGTSTYVRVLHTMNKLSGGTVVAVGGLGYATSGPKNTTLLKSIQFWLTTPVIYESLSWLALAGYGRCGHVAVSLPGGELLVAGGYNLNIYMYTTPPFSGRKTAELIKENASYMGDESIEDVGDMSAVRFVPVAELLPTGKVLIAGGTDDSLTAFALSSAELYDPSSKTFADSADTMAHARYRATSSMLSGPDGVLGTGDDMVLIVGGLVQYAPSPGPAEITDSAEIYVP